MHDLGIRLTSSKFEVCGTGVVVSRWLFSPKHGYATAVYIQRPIMTATRLRLVGSPELKTADCTPQLVKSSSLLSISDTLLSLVLLIAGKAVNTYQSVIARAIVNSLVLVLGSHRQFVFRVLQYSNEISCHHLP
jgi:hypothetical protein